MLLFKDIQVCTINNGFTSDFLHKTRGINQGCNASPLIYTYCGEILNHVVNNPENGVQGIDMKGLKNILSQFADDTAAYLKFNQLSLDAFTATLECIEANMGLKVSYDKTTLYRVGSLQNSEAALFTRRNFAWSNESLDTLGIKIQCNGKPDPDNFQKIMSKLNATCDLWINRRMSILGKVTIVNTLIGSLFVYCMTVMINLTEEQIKIANARISKFIWDNKKPKISFEQLCKKKHQGGLGLVNLKAKQKALKIAWIFKIHKDSFLENQCYDTLHCKLRQLIWSCNLKSGDVKKMVHGDSFWKQMLIAWSEINFTEPSSKGEVRSQILWCNSLIKINNSTVSWDHWIEKGLLTVSDLVSESGECVTNIPGVNWLEIVQLYAALPRQWKNLLKNDTNDKEAITKFRELSDVKNVSRKAYALLTEDAQASVKYLNRWKEKGIGLDY